MKALRIHSSDHLLVFKSLLEKYLEGVGFRVLSTDSQSIIHPCKSAMERTDAEESEAPSQRYPNDKAERRSQHRHRLDLP